MVLIPLVASLILVIAIIERLTHQKNIERIPIRVNINGVRGKSTVTRLVTGIVKEAGYKTIGKTTGTSARMIYWYTSNEKPIIRDPEGPNIKEQKRVVREAAEQGADALISECMAVNPDYQKTFQEILLQANVGVIVNVLEDHMDMLGPSLNHVAESFTTTIPYGGHLIINSSPYENFFRKEAKKRKTTVILAETTSVSEEYLREFPYIVFPENVALSMAVAKALGIDEETARRGMLHSQPDPGVLRVEQITNGTITSAFVNAFAANDASSTLAIWKRLEQLGHMTERPIVIMNCREDRMDRTEQFAKEVLPNIISETLILIGKGTEPITDAVLKKKIPTTNIVNLQGKSSQDIKKVVYQHVNGEMMFCIGNIHGAAEELLNMVQENPDTGQAS